MIITEPVAIQKTIERFLDANKEYVLRASRKGKIIIVASQRFIDGKYKDDSTEVTLKRIPVNIQSIIRQKHS